MKKKDIKSVMLSQNIPFSFVNSKGVEQKGIRKSFDIKEGCSYQLRTPMDAIYLSWYIGSCVRDDLKKLKIASMDIHQQKRIESTKQWVRKKAVIHSHAVYEEGNFIASHPTFQKKAQEIEFSKEEVLFKLQMITVLHDIGRLCEVDIQSGCKFDLPNVMGKGHDHAIESYEMLKRFGISDPVILLPIKYHGLLDFEQTLNQDQIFQELTKNQKEQVLLLSYAVRDADMGANMLAYGRVGSKECGERNDARFKHTGACYTTPICLEDIYLKRKANTNNAQTFLDIQLRWIGWGFQLHFPFYKERVAKTSVSDMFNRIFEEAADQFNNAADNLSRDQYAKTLKQLRQTKQFVMKELSPSYLKVQGSKRKLKENNGKDERE